MGRCPKLPQDPQTRVSFFFINSPENYQAFIITLNFLRNYEELFPIQIKRLYNPILSTIEKFGVTSDGLVLAQYMTLIERLRMIQVMVRNKNRMKMSRTIMNLLIYMIKTRNFTIFLIL